nr:signal recognition particle protein [Clostridia bacterium]
VLIDTAGRLHVDEELMAELVNIKSAVNPHEILLVVDAMLGQDAVNVAKTFNELLDITGVVLTKMDGDTRGGAALSVKYITGKPIKFVGTGEKLDALELFYPDRMASRILGMGDILSLIEKAEEAYDQKNAEELEKKMREQTFTLEDFLDQLRQLKKMGNLDSILAMLPGANTGALKNAQVDEGQMVKIEAIILSMTRKERTYPDIINGSRRRRIAQGSGTTVEDVNKLLKQFDQMKKLMKQFTGGGRRKRGMKFPF